MSKWYDNQSAEVVLREPRSHSGERKCLDTCLKLLKPRERELILQLQGDQEERNTQAANMGVSIIEVKKISNRLRSCIDKCLKEKDGKAFPA